VKKINSIYIIGSLRNDKIVDVANKIRETGIEAFDDWFSPGPEADDFWKKYAEKRGQTYREALNGYAAKHVFEFDKGHIDRCDCALLVQPAGKSGHLELGYVLGKSKPGFILLDQENPRWDVMLQFATGIYDSMDDFLDMLKEVNK
jgi:nucleoside 2-deoxyribosyltransferase